MNILVTGTSGRIGSEIKLALQAYHTVIGVDVAPGSMTDVVTDIRNLKSLERPIQQTDAVVHTAALHAPHVGHVSEQDFLDVNVTATENLMQAAIKHNLKHFVFTSTTALYGCASTLPGQTNWITEATSPQPRTVYHRSKVMAEETLEKLSRDSGLPVTVIQMSRCFPEPADQMAVYRLHRGCDARDVAAAHRLAAEKPSEGFARYIVSGATPFLPSDCDDLYHDAEAVIRLRAPGLAREFDRRDWPLPQRIDRIYDSSCAQRALAWRPNHDYRSCLALADPSASEVRPVINKK